MDYIKTELERVLAVDAIVSVHYYEYPIDFTFSGEIHNFWEVVYADKGDAVITAGTQEFILPRGHLYLHRPMEYHNIRCPESGTVNSFIISFYSDCEVLYRLAGKIIPCGRTVQELMALMMNEAKGAFAGAFDQVILPQLVRREDALWGSEQLLQLHLERMLILLIRRQNETPGATPPAPETHNKGDALLQRVCAYLEEHVTDNLQMEELCEHFSVSKSTLQKLFRSRIGHGVSFHYQQLKIDAAKVMIRQRRHNFTEIAEHLGYSSVHYFSRHFKQLTGMTPTEYAASMQAFMGKEDGV